MPKELTTAELFAQAEQSVLTAKDVPELARSLQTVQHNTVIVEYYADSQVHTTSLLSIGYRLLSENYALRHVLLRRIGVGPAPTVEIKLTRNEDKSITETFTVG